MDAVRHAHTTARRRLLHAAVRAALLALCVACCVLAASARATTPGRSSRANDAASHASAPAKRGSHHASCARKASFHSSGGARRPTRSHRVPCGRRQRKSRRRPTSPAASGACANAQLQPNATNLALIDAATVCLVDRERTSRGEAALKPNADLQRAALAHSSDMASRDYFAHVSSSGSTPLARMRESGYIFSPRIGYAVGENIAWATLWLATPKAIVAGWMASPGHRANILDAEFRETGVGVSPHPLSSLARGESGAIYTQDFGRIIAP